MIYLVVPDYPYEGYGEPVAAFYSQAKAIAYCNELGSADYDVSSAEIMDAENK